MGLERDKNYDEHEADKKAYPISGIFDGNGDVRAHDIRKLRVRSVR
jgi:hypothetical protein